jgi:hypothetical protein
MQLQQIARSGWTASNNEGDSDDDYANSDANVMNPGDL